MTGVGLIGQKRHIGLYVHVPFCAGKCPYCDFYSVAGDNQTMDAYTEAVCTALAVMSSRYPRRADTLYFGGGTPVLLGAKRLSRIIGAARRLFGLDSAEITVEANPSAASLRDIFSGLADAGANRLSMGLQSANPAELQFLGRKHSPDDAKRAVEEAQTAGFTNISLDLMLGIPQQTLHSVENSVAFCASLGVSHISSYLLKVEEGTPFHRQEIQKICPDCDMQAELYLRAVERLAALGYRQYEISNFSKPGKESRHNLKYWDCTEYLGVGPSAHGFMESTRYYYGRDLAAFLRDPAAVLLEATDSAVPAVDLPAGTGIDLEEYAMLRLRLADGLCLADAARLCGSVNVNAALHAAKPLQAGGLLTVNGDVIALTPDGFLLSNEVILRLLDALTAP